MAYQYRVVAGVRIITEWSSAKKARERLGKLRESNRKNKYIEIERGKGRRLWRRRKGKWIEITEALDTILPSDDDIETSGLGWCKEHEQWEWRNEHEKE